MGEEKSHKFLGPDNSDFLKSSVTLVMNARPTKYIDTYESRMIPALSIEISLTNNSGHTIPHG
jgi:hypothetical protein